MQLDAKEEGESGFWWVPGSLSYTCKWVRLKKSAPSKQGLTANISSASGP